MTQHEQNSVLEKFLALLLKDMKENPQNVQPLTVRWADSAKASVTGVEIGNINRPLDAKNE